MEQQALTTYIDHRSSEFYTGTQSSALRNPKIRVLMVLPTSKAGKLNQLNAKFSQIQSCVISPSLLSRFYHTTS